MVGKKTTKKLNQGREMDGGWPEEVGRWRDDEGLKRHFLCNGIIEANGDDDDDGDDVPLCFTP